MIINASSHHSVNERVDLLWTLPAQASSAFKPQTINLNIGMYRMLYILYRVNADKDEYNVVACPVETTPKTYSMLSIDGVENYSREFTVYSYGIEFANGGYSNYSGAGMSSTVNNESSIPYRIYGSY